MKTISKTILAALALLSSFTMQAAEEPAGREGSAAKNVIHHYFKFPSILLPAHSLSAPQPTRVEVLYTTDQAGKVNFVLAKTGDNVLKAEIEKQFYELPRLKVRGGAVQKVILTFRVI